MENLGFINATGALCHVAQYACSKLVRLIRARPISMTAIFSEPKVRNSRDGQQEYEIKVQGSSTQLFQHWLASSTDEPVCADFQSVSDGLAARELEHYHFKICNGQFNR
jgi:hypothetical protein